MLALKEMLPQFLKQAEKALLLLPAQDPQKNYSFWTTENTKN